MDNQPDNNQKNQEVSDEKKKKSLQSSDPEVIKNLEPPEDAEAISHAGKKRGDSKRYQ
jgi:hypothetical protein